MLLNYARTALLLLAMTGILVAFGALVGGQTGVLIAVAVSLAMNLFSFWGSDRFVLRMHGAQEVDAQSAPEFYDMVRGLAANAELPMPKVYIMNSPQPNAFATGRNPQNSAVCASTGLLELLNREQVAGVMAHELAHIRNRDTLIMTIAASFAGAISAFANMMQFSLMFGNSRNGGGKLGLLAKLAAVFIAPFAAMLVQMAISRSREYQADRLGAMICGNPVWLASALQTIESYARGIPNETAEMAPATAHMFIINPLSGRGFDNWFSTHPATANRVAELEQLAAEWAAASPGAPGRPAFPELAEARRRGGFSPRGRSGPTGPWG